MVHANVEIDGMVEKPDVVGALFGQTEGLLGEELDLRELQKSGRIGRIEVELRNQNGKSIGQVILPSSLDRVETAILSAALETVDRVGPCEAKVKVNKIEDTRNAKRAYLVNRAKEIIKSLMDATVPESKELSELVRDEVKTAEVQYYGPEKLPCGPNIEQADNIIVAEGRADVLTLLKCDIENVISLMGKNIPKSVIDLSRQKTVTVFVDGDRGGDLIVKQMADLGEVDFVAKAPDGKEVEELTKKEVIKCLRRKIPVEQFLSKTFKDYEPASEREDRRPRQEHFRPHEDARRAAPSMPAPGFSPIRASRPDFASAPTRMAEVPARTAIDAPLEKPVARKVEKPATPQTKIPFQSILQELNGTLRGALLDKDANVMVETDVRELAKEIEKRDDIFAIVFDGIITQRLMDLANDKKVQYIAGMKCSPVKNTGSIEIITLS